MHSYTANSYTESTESIISSKKFTLIIKQRRLKSKKKMIVIIHSLNRNVSSAFYFIGVYGIVFVFLLNINSSTLAYIKDKKIDMVLASYHILHYTYMYTHTHIYGYKHTL